MDLRFHLPAFFLALCIGAVQGGDDVDELLDAMLPGTAACFQHKKIDVERSIQNLQDCWANLAPAGMKYMTSFENAKEFMAIMCREKKELKCLENFVTKVSVCLDDDMRLVSEQIMAAFRAADGYICKNNGRPLVELLLKAETSECIGNNWATTPSCQIPFKHVIESRNITEIFDKDNCKIASSDISCFSATLQESCNDHEFIKYVEDGLQEMLDATACQNYLVKQNYMLKKAYQSGHQQMSTFGPIAIVAVAIFLKFIAIF